MLNSKLEKSTDRFQYNPLKFELYAGDSLEIVGNDRGLFHFEWKRDRGSIASDSTNIDTDRHHGKDVVDYGEDGLAIYADGSREQKKADTARQDCE